MTSEPSTPPSVTPFAVPLVWKPDESLTTVYANQLFISRAASEYYLSFGELVPPTLMEGAQLPAFVTIKEVARIAMTPDLLQQVADVIQSSLARFKTPDNPAIKEGG